MQKLQELRATLSHKLFEDILTIGNIKRRQKNTSERNTNRFEINDESLLHVHCFNRIDER